MSGMTTSESITFWVQPGGWYWKRIDSEGSRLVTPEEMSDECQGLQLQGWIFTSDGVKWTGTSPVRRGD